ncbi:MAG: hypothetical protein U1E39_16395 [Planctomycetota bacterium]
MRGRTTSWLGTWLAPASGLVAVILGVAPASGSPCDGPVGRSRTVLPVGAIPENLREPADPAPVSDPPPTKPAEPAPETPPPTTPEEPPAPAPETPTEPPTPPPTATPPATTPPAEPPPTDTTPTEPPATPPAPTPPAPPRVARATPPTTAPNRAAPGDDAGERGRRAPARDDSAWEVWWAVHRFEFLAPADHRAELTGDAAPAVPEAKRAEVRARLLDLAREAGCYRLRGAAVAAALRLATPAEAADMEPMIRHGLTTHNLVHAMHVGNALSYASATPLVPMLHRLAKDASVESHVRGLVALAMPTLYPEAADGLLVELLRADDGREPPFDEAVLLALGATRDAAGAAALERVVRDLDRPAAHRATALTSLARRGLDVRAIAFEMLDDRRVEVRRAAAQALGVLPWAVPPADGAARAPRDRETSEALEKMLERLQGERLAALEAPVREACVRLGRVLLRERDRSVRAAAAVSLGRIARAADAGVAVRLLLAEVRRDGDLREHAMLALAIANAPEAVPVFQRALLDGRAAATTRAAAAIALGLAGATQGIDLLRRTLADDPNPQVRGYAAVALGMLRDAASAPLARRQFDTTANVEARGQFGIALGLLGRRDDATALADRLGRGGSAATLWNLVEAIRLAARTHPVDALLAIAEDPDTDAAPEAVRALAAILAPNDGGKPDRVKSFDHLHAEEYLLGYVIDP